ATRINPGLRARAARLPSRGGNAYLVEIREARMRGLKTAWSMTKQTFSEWSDDKGGRLGAALSYYTVFSLAPLLLVVVSIAGLVFGEEAARGELFGQLASLMGADAAKAVEGVLTSVNKPGKGIAATTLGVGLLLVGATTVFGEL